MKNQFKVDGNIVKIFLGNGLTTIIGIDDLPRAQKFPGLWRGIQSGNNLYVAGTLSRKGETTTIYLHRYITQCPSGFVVDHINFDGLDNRRENLRIVTHAENLQNLVGAKSNSKSGSRNVFYDKYFDKWVAEVSVNGETVYKKRFVHQSDAEVAAAMARLKYQPFSPEGTAARTGGRQYPGLIDFVEYDI